MPATRVVVVTHAAELGGAELALLRLLDHLPPSAADVHVVTWSEGDLPESLRARGVPVTVLGGQRLGRVTRAQAGRWGSLSRGPQVAVLAARLRRVIRRHGADVVVAHSLKAAFVTALAAPLANRPWVWHLHDRLALDYLPVSLVRATHMLAARGPRAIVANSQHTRATLPTRARGRTIVVHPGVEPALLARERTPPSVPTVGIVGRISETKGQLQFIAAAHELSGDRPQVRFVIIGAALFADHDYEEHVRSAAGTDVEMLGWTEDPVEAIAGLTVLVHASPTPEPFGQVVAEAIALGVPVVATAAGGVPEILDPRGDARHRPGGDAVVDMGTGVLVAPGSVPGLVRGIATVLDDRARWRLSETARAELGSRLAVGVTAQRAVEIWRSTAHRHGGAA